MAKSTGFSVLSSTPFSLASLTAGMVISVNASMRSWKPSLASCTAAGDDGKASTASCAASLASCAALSASSSAAFSVGVIKPFALASSNASSAAW